MATPSPSSSSSSQLHLILFLLLSTAILSPAHETHEFETKEGERVAPYAVERAIGITGFNSHWEAFSAWLKLAWMNLRPPDSGYGGKEGAGETVKAASKKSFQASKDTVERTAAKVAEKVKEKLKRSVSNSAADL